MLTMTKSEIDMDRLFGPHKTLPISTMFAGILTQQRERAVHETAGRASVIETAAALVRNPDLAGDLRLIQRAVDRNPRVATVFRALLESAQPSDQQYVRRMGLRSLRLPAAKRSPAVLNLGGRPVTIESAPRQAPPRQPKRLPNMNDHELSVFLHSGKLPGQLPGW